MSRKIERNVNLMTMTHKGFLAKTKTKAANSALAFLSAHSEFLLTGALAPLTRPILIKVDAKELLPTEGLKQIKDVVFSHMMALDMAKAQESLTRSEDLKITKPYKVTLFSAVDGSVIQEDKKDLIKGFDMAQDAERWADLRLVENPNSRAEIAWHGNTTLTLVTRDEAFARVYPKSKGGATKRTGVNMSKLGFGVKASQTRSHFSRG